MNKYIHACLEIISFIIVTILIVPLSTYKPISWNEFVAKECRGGACFLPPFFSYIGTTTQGMPMNMSIILCIFGCLWALRLIFTGIYTIYILQIGQDIFNNTIDFLTDAPKVHEDYAFQVWKVSKIQTYINNTPSENNLRKEYKRLHKE